MTGTQKAVWWTEYVIRHKGTKHLRGGAVDIPLYQYYLLDVIGSILVILGIMLFVFYKLFKFFIYYGRLLFQPKIKTN